MVNVSSVAPAISVTRYVRILAALVVLVGVASIGHLYVKVGQMEARVASASFLCRIDQDCEGLFAGSPYYAVPFIQTRKFHIIVLLQHRLHHQLLNSSMIEELAVV